MYTYIIYMYIFICVYVGVGVCVCACVYGTTWGLQWHLSQKFILNTLPSLNYDKTWTKKFSYFI